MGKAVPENREKMAVDLKFASKVLHVVAFSCILANQCNNRGCNFSWDTIVYVFAATCISLVVGIILLILRWRKKHDDKAEKCVWIIGHYMVFASAILLSNARRGNDLMITTCVFVWADFAVYLLELAIYFDLARRH